MSSPEGKNHSPDDQRSSVSDGDLDAEKKKRRARRRRGTRGRFRPYDLNETEAELGSSNGERKRTRTNTGRTMAPNNTTQFLLEDMEARVEAEREVDEAYCAEERQRVRSLSVSSELFVPSDDEGSGCSIGDDEHREFETDLQEYNIERISHLSKDQMTQEILDKDKTAEAYHHNLVKVNRENERLKRLLHDNGIALETEGTPHSHVAPVA